ncbi:alpha-xenorhabdolysin family binary toxin subunit A [Variovorax fucosicus]|uniref:alpha-xenorhabdolysin family binary toxin subunit A n=1 Tax=Variovorax fucosicus TaxID=3053517 RepID=UPI002575A860|nr:alpha-xenorhabdolysin family binary toxin subunit A [Variovorax sp. J22G47]MDM0058986.1 alpha-xenorhabdolysin family binary toxin subunit A [Variovorax sp. J22G47]
MLDIGPRSLADKPPVTEPPPAVSARDGKPVAPKDQTAPKAPTAADLTDIKGSPFLLSQREWLSVQRYVTNAMALATEEAKLRIALQMPPDMKFDDFVQLLDGHQTIVPHVTKWKTKIHPDTVSLAADVAHYGTSAPALYGGLVKFINRLLANRKDNEAKVGLAALIAKLAKEASDMAEKAKTQYGAIQQFSHETATDAVLVQTLVSTYAKKFDANSAWGKDVAEKLKTIRKSIEDDTKIYEHAMAVACSTPAYAWIIVPPIGLIAAIIVAGVYADIVIHARNRLEDLNKQLNAATANERVVFMLNCSLGVTNHSLTSIQSDIQAALPVIQKIQGVWGAIRDDFDRIGKLVAKDIDEAILELKDLVVDEALAQWKEVKVKADAYRANAYIEFG